MKHDPRLNGLSSEHHHALVLARDLTDEQSAWTPEAGVTLGKRFALELEPHFRLEEEVLLPALRRAGETSLVDRIAVDHAFLRTSVEAARAGDARAARAFGERLREHVRFEERELFPACTRTLPDEVLDEIARRAPKSH